MSTTHEAVPAAVRELVRERIQALEQLEILLMLQQRPAKTWVPDELALNLHLHAMSVEAAIAHLCHHGFVACDARGQYRYAPADCRVDELVAALARSYAHARGDVLALISSEAVDGVGRRARVLMRRLSNRPARLVS